MCSEKSRTHPMQKKVQTLCRHIEAHAGERLTLDAMSRQINVSPYHLQRAFKSIMGLTPRQYAEACRARLLRHELRNGHGRSASDAIYEAGFSSSSRVYERADAQLGMTPRQYRLGGAGVEISYAIGQTPLGKLIIGATDRGVCFVQFGASDSALLDQMKLEYPRADLRPMPQGRSEFSEWMQALADYLDGSRHTLDFALDVQGTAFQIRVWHYLQSIPYGTVQSYTEVAQAIGSPAAVRAVASAIAANSVALLIPCHRVIRGDGSLGGYRWGLERKQNLIELERKHRDKST